MYGAERQQQIVIEARRQGRVEVTALAESLGVTPETVRRDLSTLENRGVLKRVHGGAIPVERLDLEPALTVRSSRLTEQKKRIAARALDEIAAGATVLLDSGSTTHALAEMLPPDRDLTVVTNSMQIGDLLSGRAGLTLFVIGGRVRGLTGAAVGEWALTALRSLTVDLAFVGTNGMSADRGLTTPDQAEASVKSAMLDAARRSVLLADASKFGTDHLHTFAGLDRIDLIVTDDALAAADAKALAARGPQVVRA
ncbi:DeoR/GlpR transcriptional regulator [Calidifontibacter sp. DB0510]|uniref:Lactose phosphotransferase system repressor n=1 Tax=Metallococcus carri TaxID=1656884 RepID=A0A967B4R8_9MICO|nr:DeoR/GlpR family DNA-binding transcription regulator [Metallococcus carri]NHN57335.1 DeoR/GlpR transcriptional regulator [Metallococcus carri]NOP38060.1 DeoR/GlpR transcriptional regulator [Calidifontibacter sp. DB2511S]